MSFRALAMLNRATKLVVMLPLLAILLVLETGCFQGSVLSDDNFKVTLDPAGHAQYIQMPTDAALTIVEVFAIGGLRNDYGTQATAPSDTVKVTGPFPWVEVSGPLNPDGSFSLAGIGTVAGYPNVAVALTGTVDQTGKISGTYKMGTNGALPTGQSITYSITGQVRIPTGTPLISAAPGLLQFSTPFGANPGSQPLTIANGGSGALGWSATPSTDSGSNWLSLDSTGSIAPSKVNISVNSANLARGAYTGKINIVGLPQGGVPNSPQSVRVELAVGVPQVFVGGVVNSASYTLTSPTVAPGSIADVFGGNLTDGTSCLPPTCYPSFGSDGKLNTTLTGAQAKINGTAVPLLFSNSSPGQLAVQIPSELTGTSATVQVTVNGQTSVSETLSLAPVAPGIFTTDASGKGIGAITHVDGSAINPQNPAHAGELVILYATGLGQTNPPVPTGLLPVSISSAVAATTVVVDGVSVTPDFAGLSGCCVGQNQVTFRIPASTRSASDIPVLLQIGTVNSNTVTMAVQ